MERGGATGKDCGGDGVRRPEKCAATKKHRGQNRAKADEAGHGRRKGEVAGDGGAAGKTTAAKKAQSVKNKIKRPESAW